MKRRMTALAAAAALATAMVGASAGTALASTTAHHDLRYGPQIGPDSGLTLAHAPAGLRAAVHRTLGTAAPAGSAFQKDKLTASDGAQNDDLGYSVAISGTTAVVGAPTKNTATGAAYVFVKSGQTWRQQAKLTAGDGGESNYFGDSVAISGSTAVVGAYGKNSNTGAVYVFNRSTTGTWSQKTELTASDGADNDYFGWSVAIAKSTVVTGAIGNANSTGAAYVFARSGSTWSQQAELTASGGAAGDRFGASVAVSGSTAVVGAYASNSDAGAAYVFTHSGKTWSQQTELTASDSAANDYFGYSVAIAGSTVVVGAPHKNGYTGAAYVFTRSGSNWSQQAKLTAADGTDDDEFGFAVAVSGATALVSAPDHNDYTGAAYVFTRSDSGSWTQESELTAADGVSTDAFGDSVALAGSTALVGTPNNNSNTGATYVFALPALQAELTASDATTQTYFGYSVAISGSTAVVGAPYGDGDTEDGSAYVFVRSATGTWSQQAELIASDATGLSYFGYSVAISGSRIVVGASGANSGAGAAYVFMRSAPGKWKERAELADPGGSNSDAFGRSVAISGSTALVGAPGTNSVTGVAYVFAGSGGTWSQQATLADPSNTARDDFGYSVALAGSTAVVGAPGNDARTGAAWVFTGSGSTWTYQAGLTPTDGIGTGGVFGSSVAIAKSTIVVGQPDTGSGPGAAFVYTYSGGVWTEQAELTASDGVAGDGFGWSVAVSGSTVVAGAIARDTGTGAAYVFTGSGGTWTQAAELTAADGQQYGYFGAAVAVSGSTAVVPAYGVNDRTGATYMYGNV